MNKQNLIFPQWTCQIVHLYAWRCNSTKLSVQRGKKKREGERERGKDLILIVAFCGEPLQKNTQVHYIWYQFEQERSSNLYNISSINGSAKRAKLYAFSHYLIYLYNKKGSISLVMHVTKTNYLKYIQKVQFF